MDKDKILFSNFPPVTTEEWEEVIKKDLKGADYERKLVWRTDEQFKVNPYYRMEDMEDIFHLSEDGTFPYTKDDASNWKIRQDFVVENPKETNALIHKAVKGGAESIGIDVKKFPEFTKEHLYNTLKGICPEQTEINIICNQNALSVLETLERFFEEEKLIAERIYINIEFDPFEEFVTEGKSYLDGIDLLRELITKCNFAPNMRVGILNGALYGNCGSSITEELAFTFNEVADLLDFLTESGLTIDEIAKRIKFKFGVGSNYFLEIAKFRTARYIWAKIFESYEPKDLTNGKMYIHAETSSWNKTIYDPYVNLLRTTTESMSSVIGGIDSLTVLPFNFITTKDDDFSLRLARNQQILLKEESNFDKVTDPAAGSYYVETLTKSFINNAWNQFLMVVEKGGFIKCFKENFIQDIITETSEKRNKNVAIRRESFVGVNQYPNISETIDFVPETLLETDEDIEDIEEESGCGCCISGDQFKLLEPYRGPECFERLRLETELYTKESGKRPTVFLFTYGNLGMRIARAGFATNFFGCAGFDIINNNGFSSVEVGIEAAKASKAEITVICSSDEEYATIAPPIYDGLKDDCIVVVAGNPKDSIDMLKEKGIEHFIHVRTNLLETLTEIQKQIIK